MQNDKSNFLPYFFTEPIYYLKKEFVNEKGEKNPLKQAGETLSSQTGVQDLLHKNNTQVMEPVQKLQTKPESIKSPPILKYTGKNLKNILILFEDQNEEKLPSTQEVFLGKILHAVNLNFDDVAIVNTAHLEDALLEQLNHFNAFVQISFGVKHQALSFKADVPAYKIYKKADKTFLLADELAVIEKEKEKKILLWNNLKSLFSNQ